LATRRDVDQVGADADDHAARDPLAAAVHRGAHAADGLAEADEQRLPHHEVADVEFGDLGQRRDRLGGLVVEAVAGMNLEPGGARQLRAVATMRCHSASALAVWPSTTASHQPPVWISITGARSLAAISICAGRRR
jgi:hypothetical protein